MPQFVYLLRPARAAMLTEGPTAAEARSVDAHVQHLAEGTRRGHVLLAGRTTEDDGDTFGLVLLECPSESGAAAAMAADPAVRDGVMTAELHPFRTAFAAPAALAAGAAVAAPEATS
jgi:uncharacterized protein YciI